MATAIAIFIADSIGLSAQSDDKEQVWLPPSWVLGNGYTPYDYPGGALSYGFDPFFYYGLAGKTYNPYGDAFAYYNYQGKTYNPYSDYYWYPQSYWYPYSYRQLLLAVLKAMLEANCIDLLRHILL